MLFFFLFRAAGEEKKKWEIPRLAVHLAGRETGLAVGMRIVLQWFLLFFEGRFHSSPVRSRRSTQRLLGTVQQERWQLLNAWLRSGGSWLLCRPLENTWREGSRWGGGTLLVRGRLRRYHKPASCAWITSKKDSNCSRARVWSCQRWFHMLDITLDCTVE